LPQKDGFEEPSESEGSESEDVRVPLLVQLGFFFALDPWDHSELIRFEVEKREKFFFWPEDWGCGIVFSGLGRGWRGWRSRGVLVSHGWLPATRSSVVNALFAWTGHVMDLSRLSRRGKVIALCSPDGGVGGVLARALWSRHIHLVVRFEGDSATKSLARGKRVRYLVRSRIERFVARRADLVVANSHYTSDLATSYGVRPDRIFIVMSRPRWGPLSDVPPLPKTERVLYVGRFVAEKGVHTLLDAMRRVRTMLPKCELFMAGDGPCRKELETRVQVLGLGSVVHFTGWLPDEKLREAYATASMVVLPSLWGEGWSQALTEASIFGRPLVASDIGALKELVRHGENGLLSPPADAEALAEAILAILTDRGLAERMGSSAASIAREWIEQRQEASEKVRVALRELSQRPG
jgi:glycosyltransferase involved in cell wall biosynthesis